MVLFVVRSCLAERQGESLADDETEQRKDREGETGQSKPPAPRVMGRPSEPGKRGGRGHWLKKNFSRAGAGPAGATEPLLRVRSISRSHLVGEPPRASDGGKERRWAECDGERGDGPEDGKASGGLLHVRTDQCAFVDLSSLADPDPVPWRLGGGQSKMALCFASTVAGEETAALELELEPWAGWHCAPSNLRVPGLDPPLVNRLLCIELAILLGRLWSSLTK
jgi:hypothetical protein